MEIGSIIAILIVAAVVGFAVFKASRPRPPVGGGILPADEPEKPARPISRK